MKIHNLSLTEQEYQRSLEEVTLDYIERYEAGEQPNLTDYQARYPELAQDLASNITYYHLEGRELVRQIEQEEATPGYATRLKAQIEQDPTFLAKRDQLLDKILGMSAPSTNSAAAVLSSFDEAADRKNMGLDELAEQAGISLDLMVALDQHLIKIAGLPRKLVSRLAELLEVPADIILNTLRQPSTSPAFHFNQNIPGQVEPQEFAFLVERSLQLDPQQKAAWLFEVEKDAYSATSLT